MMLEELIAKIEIRHPPFPIRLVAQSGLPGLSYDKRLVIEVTVPDRDTGTHRVLQHSFSWPYDDYYSLAAASARMHRICALRTIERYIRYVIEHEVAEVFFFDGVRIFDPHKDKETPP